MIVFKHSKNISDFSEKSDNYILDLEFRCRFHNPNTGFVVGMENKSWST